jgi:predicted dehydrogenase/nucleoside-diphosphate-sugar epimerase
MRIERVGLVGLGYIAGFHAAAARTASPGAQLIGLDLDPAAARRAERVGLVDTTVGSLDDLLAAAPDVVHVLTPPAAHVAPAVALLQRGVDVLLEKPLAHTPQAAAEIAEAARRGGAAVGVSHNLLFDPVWRRTRELLDAGEIGLLRSVDITTRRPVPALRTEDAGVWMLQGSDHVLFEIAPHAFAHVLDLVPSLEVAAVVTGSAQHLPNGVAFVRSWEVLGRSGDIGVRLSLAFDDAYAESTIQLRGTLGQLEVDLDRSTLAVTRRGSASYDLELARQTFGAAGALARSAARRFIDVVASKVGVSGWDEPFAAGIAASVATFHRRPERALVDRRQSLDLAAAVVDLADTVAERSGVDRCPPVRVTRPRVAPVLAAATARPEVVVLGGTGFIGRHLVRRLARTRPVLVVARRPDVAAALFADLAVDVVSGDIADTESICRHVRADTTVVDLAFSGGTTWEMLSALDLEATCRLADELCARKIRRYVYTSTIAIYDAGRPGEVITERTPAGRGTVRVAPYPRMKLAVERHLEHLHHTAGFPVVVARPGVVVGVDSEPCHWGVAAWPYSNVCVHWGSGDRPLPLVLVDDVADALAAMIDVDGIEGESFNLCADAGVTAADYVSALAAATGEPIRAVPRSTSRWFGASLATWAVKRPGPGRVPFPSWRELAGRGCSARFDCAKASTVLGWSPEMRATEVVRRGVLEPAKAWQR